MKTKESLHRLGRVIRFSLGAWMISIGTDLVSHDAGIGTIDRLADIIEHIRGDLRRL